MPNNAGVSRYHLLLAPALTPKLRCPNSCSFESVALVWKRFHQACLAPALLHTIVITLLSCSSKSRRLSSLLEFLSSPLAVHVHSLHLCAARSELLQEDADSRTETTALLLACLTACWRLALEELRVWSLVDLSSLGYLPSLTSLRRLQLLDAEAVLPLLPPGRQASCLLLFGHS